MIGPFPNTYDGIPEGLTDVSGGLGPEGMKLKVEILEGTPFVHSPDCASIPDQPITQHELKEYKSHTSAKSIEIQIKSLPQKHSPHG